MDTTCHLLKTKPTKEQLDSAHRTFNHIKSYVDDDHLFRYLLQCDTCGQMYFYEFKEEIDWDNGDDSQYNTYIPVKSVEEADALSNKSSFELLGITPRIQNDMGKGNNGEVRLIR